MASLGDVKKDREEQCLKQTSKDAPEQEAGASMLPCAEALPGDNKLKRSYGAKSGFVGVRSMGNQWLAYVEDRSGQRKLGIFGTPLEAARARREALEKMASVEADRATVTNEEDSRASGPVQEENGVPRDGLRKVRASEVWACRLCTLENPAIAKECKACGTNKPVQTRSTRRGSGGTAGPAAQAAEAEKQTREGSTDAEGEAGEEGKEVDMPMVEKDDKTKAIHEGSDLDAEGKADVGGTSGIDGKTDGGANADGSCMKEELQEEEAPMVLEDEEVKEVQVPLVVCRNGQLSVYELERAVKLKRNQELLAQLGLAGKQDNNRVAEVNKPKQKRRKSQRPGEDSVGDTGSIKARGALRNQLFRDKFGSPRTG